MSVKIADLLPLPVGIKVGSGELKIRGITLKEMLGLLARHKDVIVTFVGGGEQDLEKLLVTAPDMVAEVIAMAADAQGQEADVARLPAAAQLDALTAVWELSVPDLKKLKESLSRVTAALRPETVSKQSPSLPETP
jgi:precorrin-6B methylase 2